MLTQTDLLYPPSVVLAGTWQFLDFLENIGRNGWAVTEGIAVNRDGWRKRPGNVLTRCYFQLLAEGIGTVMYRVLREVAIADSTPTRYSEAELSALSHNICRQRWPSGGWTVDTHDLARFPINLTWGSPSAYVLQSKFLPSKTAAPDLSDGSLSMWGVSDVPFRFGNTPRGAVQLGLVMEATLSDRANSYQIDIF